MRVKVQTSFKTVLKLVNFMLRTADPENAVVVHAVEVNDLDGGGMLMTWTGMGRGR